MKRKITRKMSDGSMHIVEEDDEAPAHRKAEMSGKNQGPDAKSQYLERMASQGHKGDTRLAHVSPWEEALLKKLGGVGTRNPHTGLKQFYTKDDISSWYTNALGRPADPGGLDYWTNYAATNPDEQVWKAFSAGTTAQGAVEPGLNAAWNPLGTPGTLYQEPAVPLVDQYASQRAGWLAEQQANVDQQNAIQPFTAEQIHDMQIDPATGQTYGYAKQVASGGPNTWDGTPTNNLSGGNTPAQGGLPAVNLPGAGAITTPIVSTAAPTTPLGSPLPVVTAPPVSGTPAPFVSTGQPVPGMGTSTNQPVVKTAGPNTATGTDIRPGTTGYVAPVTDTPTYYTPTKTLPTAPEVTLWYQQNLGRNPSASDLAYWTTYGDIPAESSDPFAAFKAAALSSTAVEPGLNPAWKTATTVSGGTGIDLPLNIMPTSGSVNSSTGTNSSVSTGGSDAQNTSTNVSTSNANNYSGLPKDFQEQLLAAIIPQLTDATKNMGANYDKYTNEALGSYQQMMQNALRTNIPKALGYLANRGIINSTEGQNVLGNVGSAAAIDASTKGYTTAMQQALLKANMPQVLAQLADLGKTSYGTSTGTNIGTSQGTSSAANFSTSAGNTNSVGSSYSQDPTRMYSELAAIIRAMM